MYLEWVACSPVFSIMENQQGSLHNLNEDTSWTNLAPGNHVTRAETAFPCLSISERRMMSMQF